MQELNIINNYLTEDQSQELILHVSSLEMDKYPKGKIFGKEITFHRIIGFYSDNSIGYKFSGGLMKSRKLTDTLIFLLNKVNNDYNADYNGILINIYDNGLDYISAHSDDEKELGNIPVRCLSLGCSRILRIRDKCTKKRLIDIKTENGQMIEMLGDFQKKYLHEIPKDKSSETRISLTFRKHNK